MYVRPHRGRGREVPGIAPRLPEAESEVEVEDDEAGAVVGARRGAGVGIGLDGIGIVLVGCLVFRYKKGVGVSQYING